jgi:transposase-like protein
MEKDSTKKLGRVVHIDEKKLHGHLDEMVRGTMEQTLNDLLDAEADRPCNAPKYSRSPDRVGRRAGHYQRKLLTKVDEVKLKVPKLREAVFETAIIERYRRRESSVEETMIEMYLAGVSVKRVESITETLWRAYLTAIKSEQHLAGSQVGQLILYQIRSAQHAQYFVLLIRLDTGHFNDIFDAYRGRSGYAKGCDVHRFHRGLLGLVQSGRPLVWKAIGPVD